MTRYLSITADQRPFVFDVDEQTRHMFSVNFSATARAPVGDWEREMASLIAGAGLGTLGTDMFIGTVALLDGAGPIVQLIDTGGTAASRAHGGEELEMLSMQVVVRAEDYDAARDRALAIWRLLDGRYNETVAV